MLDVVMAFYDALQANLLLYIGGSATLLHTLLYFSCLYHASKVVAHKLCVATLHSARPGAFHEH